jgi:hypothetical protein
MNIYLTLMPNRGHKKNVDKTLRKMWLTSNFLLSPLFLLAHRWLCSTECFTCHCLADSIAWPCRTPGVFTKNRTSPPCGSLICFNLQMQVRGKNIIVLKITYKCMGAHFKLICRLGMKVVRILSVRPTNRKVKHSNGKTVSESGHLISVTICTALVFWNSKLNNFYDSNMMNINIRHKRYCLYPNSIRKFNPRKKKHLYMYPQDAFHFHP